MNNKLLSIFRAWRVVTLASMLFMVLLAWDVWQWFKTLPDPTTGQGTFAGGVILAVVGVLKFWMETKANEGGKDGHSD